MNPYNKATEGEALIRAQIPFLQQTFTFNEVTISLMVHNHCSSWFVHARHECADGRTLEEAVNKLANKFRDTTDEQRAQEKRAEAQRLLAEADSISPQIVARPTQDGVQSGQ